MQVKRPLGRLTSLLFFTYKEPFCTYVDRKVSLTSRMSSMYSLSFIWARLSLWCNPLAIIFILKYLFTGETLQLLNLGPIYLLTQFNFVNNNNLLLIVIIIGASLIAQLVIKNMLAMQATLVQFWVRNIPRRRDRLTTPVFLGFPYGSAGKESACNEGDLSSIPQLRRRERLPTPVFWPGEFHGLYSPWGHKVPNRTKQLSLSIIIIKMLAHQL